MEFKPRKHQDISIRAAKVNPYFALFLDMGLGKTSVTLTTMKFLLDSMTVLKPLIIAPKFVTQHTWPEEIEKWDHLKGLTYSVIAGTEKERLMGIRAKADVYIISWDNIVWLTELNRFRRKWPFDMLVLDESTKVKNRDSKRFKVLRKIRPRVSRVMLLTGTPTPHSLMDLWSQMYLLDQGERLNKYIEKFRGTYFYPERTLPHGGCVYGIHPGAEEMIFDKIKDVCLSMKAVDWIDVPARHDIIKEIELDDYKEYRQFKKDKILELPEGEITAFNATALYNKLLQYANGAVYDSDKVYHVVHNKKLDALEEAIEELQGKPVIIFYQFQSDIDRIKKRIKNVTLLKTVEHIKAWNRQEVPILLAHAASAGHGLNLQDGGNYIFWFGVGDNMEWYWQAVTRIHRQGQKKIVFNYHFMIKGTPELRVYKGLLDKTLTQDRLMAALK